MHPKVDRFWQAIRVSWQRYLVAVVCFAIVVLRIAFPKMNVDWVAVFLLAIAALAIAVPRYQQLIPHLIQVLPYIKKAKVAGIEVELTDEIKKLSQNVDQAEEAVAAKGGILVGNEFAKGQAEVLEELKTDPKAAFLLLAAKVEQQVMSRLEQRHLRRPGEFIPIRRAVQLGVEHGVFPQQILGMVNDFWAIRNKVAHGMAFDVDTSVILSLNSVGLEILKLLSAQGDDDSGELK